MFCHRGLYCVSKVYSSALLQYHCTDNKFDVDFVPKSQISESKFARQKSVKNNSLFTNSQQNIILNKSLQNVLCVGKMVHERCSS